MEHMAHMLFKRYLLLFFMAFLQFETVFAGVLMDKPEKSLPSLNELFDGYCSKNLLFSASSGNAGSLIFLSGEGNIRFAQTFYYTNIDNGVCSNIIATASVIDDAGRGIPVHEVTPNGQPLCETLQLSATSIYSSIQNQGVNPEDVTCMQVFFDGSSESFEGVPCQNFTDISCVNDACTSNQTKAVNWEANPPRCTTRYAYITNLINNTVSQCAISSDDGSLSDCAVTIGSVFDEPSLGIAFDSNYVFISNKANNTLEQCTFDADTGAFNLCSISDLGISLDAPEGIVISNGYIVIANYGDPDNSDPGSMSLCELDSGEVSNCSSYTGTGFENPAGIALLNSNIIFSTKNNKLWDCGISSGGVADCFEISISGLNDPKGIAVADSHYYVANKKDNNVVVCPTGSTPDTCATTGSGLDEPDGILVNNGYVYITNNGSSKVSLCTLNSGGGSFNCKDSSGNHVYTGSGFNIPKGITYNNGYVYVNNKGNSTVSKCEVSSSDGSLSNCESVVENPLTSPSGIVANNGYAYVTDSSQVFKCLINPTARNLNNCTAVVSNLEIPPGITVNTNSIYITESNDSGGQIEQCAISSSDGSLSCNTSFSGGLDAPQSIVLYKGYAYVPNALSNNVAVCPYYASDGGLGACSATGSNLNGPRGISIANDIAYITNENNNSITYCSVLPNSSGTFSNCHSVSISNPTITLDVPAGIKVIGDKVYVISQANNTVFLCDIAAVGEFENCVATNNQLFNNPLYMAVY